MDDPAVSPPPSTNAARALLFGLVFASIFLVGGLVLWSHEGLILNLDQARLGDSNLTELTHMQLQEITERLDRIEQRLDTIAPVAPDAAAATASASRAAPVDR